MRLKVKHLICYVVLFTFVSVLITVFSLLDIATSFAGNLSGKEVILHDILCKKFVVNTTIQTTTETTARPSMSSQAAVSERELYSPYIRAILDSLKSNVFVTGDNSTTSYDSEFEMYNYSQQLKPFHRYLFMDKSNNSDYELLRQLFPCSSPRNVPYEDRIEKQLRLRLNSTTTKLILVYFQDPNLRTQNLQNSGCEITNCIFTTKISDLTKADAVIFRHLSEKLTRPVNKTDQVWIYSQLESAGNTFLPKKHKVNWTATYRTSSVLNTPYAKFRPYPNVTRLPVKSTVNYAVNKTKLAAWFVSNCHGRNGRMAYVKLLQKYAKVDIYGHCGPHKCDRFSNNCFQMLQNEYKFYLAFENTNCRDYITEKFFLNALENNVVPIVMGAHPDDYEKLAPPHSYIHVDEFASPRQLAEYLHILDNNDDFYNLYFRWKGTGEFMNTKFICRLCAMVQIAPLFPTWYEDLSDWWSNGTCVTRRNKEDWATWRRILRRS